MANLLEQAIDCDDGDLAAKIIQHALGIESATSPITAFRKRGQRIVNGGPASLAIGCGPRYASWPEPCRTLRSSI